jgi:hypothetical protein
VRSDRKPEVYACGFCHRVDGLVGPENASLAGLPEAYIVQQMADFKSVRKSVRGAKSYAADTDGQDCENHHGRGGCRGRSVLFQFSLVAYAASLNRKRRSQS